MEEWSEEIRSKKEFGSRLWENLNVINILVLFFWQVGLWDFCHEEQKMQKGEALIRLLCIMMNRERENREVRPNEMSQER